MKEDKVLPVWITVPTLSKDHLLIYALVKKNVSPSLMCWKKKFVAHPCAHVEDHAMDSPNSDQIMLVDDC